MLPVPLVKSEMPGPPRTAAAHFAGPGIMLSFVVGLLMMAGRPLVTWMPLIICLVIGLVVYFGYCSRHSRLRHA